MRVSGKERGKRLRGYTDDTMQLIFAIMGTSDHDVLALMHEITGTIDSEEEVAKKLRLLIEGRLEEEEKRQLLISHYIFLTTGEMERVNESFVQKVRENRSLEQFEKKLQSYSYSTISLITFISHYAKETMLVKCEIIYTTESEEEVVRKLNLLKDNKLEFKELEGTLITEEIYNISKKCVDSLNRRRQEMDEYLKSKGKPTGRGMVRYSASDFVKEDNKPKNDN